MRECERGHCASSSGSSTALQARTRYARNHRRGHFRSPIFVQPPPFKAARPRERSSLKPPLPRPRLPLDERKPCKFSLLRVSWRTAWVTRVVNFFGPRTLLALTSFPENNKGISEKRESRTTQRYRGLCVA